MVKAFLAGAAALAFVLAAPAAAADTRVVPAQFENAPAPHFIYSVFGNGSQPFSIYQFAFAGSLLNGVAPGTVINRIGFRLDETESAPPAPVSYSQFDITLSGLARPLGRLSGDIAQNIGAGATLVRAGALTLDPADFPAGPPNSRRDFFDIGFDAGFVYQGGDLLVTIRRQAAPAMTFVPRIAVDGIARDGVTIDTAIEYGNGSPPSVGFLNAPVTRFGFGAAPVPEPATWALLIAGFGLAGATLRARARPAAAAA